MDNYNGSGSAQIKHKIQSEFGDNPNSGNELARPYNKK